MPTSTSTTAPDAQEQLMIELINRARLDPNAEVDRIGTSDAALASGVSGAPVQALAWVPQLGDAAQGHSDDMLARNFFAHTNPFTGKSPFDRMRDEGYNYLTAGENIGWIGAFNDPYSANRLTWHHDNLWESDGHQRNLMNGNFSEIGVGYAVGSYTYNGTTYQNSSMVTQKFGDRGYQYLTGVVIDDLDSDEFYDIGEGQGQVQITATNGSGSFSTATWDAGGYSLALEAGTYTVTFQGGDLAGSFTTTVTIGSSNVKLDVIEDRDASGSSEPADTSGDAPELAEAPAPLPPEPAPAPAPLPTATGRDDLLIMTEGDDVISGRAGDDEIQGLGGHDQLNGARGNDTLLGGTGNDTLKGGGNNDRLEGGDGDDLLEGGSGLDSLFGDAGNDILKGGGSHDRLEGGDGDDLLEGGTGLDSLFGDAGNDILKGGGSHDQLEGGDGDDRLEGSFGRDILRGDAGSDTLLGGGSHDQLDGGSGNDHLEGGAGVDTLFGGSGADRLDGGRANDTLTGGADADVFVFSARGYGRDTVTDFNTAEDTIEFLNVRREFTDLSDHSSVVDGDLIIKIGRGSLTLEGVTDASEVDFLFA